MLPTALNSVDTVLNQVTQQYWQTHSAEIDALDPWAAELRAMVEEYTLRQGKGTRPLLVAIGASLALGQSLETVLADARVQRLMLSVELTHKHFLMADDVFDRDELRQGKPSFHLLMEAKLRSLPHFSSLPKAELEHYARSFTEWMGIWLQGFASWLLLDGSLFSPEQLQRLERVFRRELYDYTVVGEVLLADQAKQPLNDTVSEAQFLRGLEYVTGHYSAVGPLRVGACLGTLNPELETTLLNFGRALGTLHQVTDDLIGLYGDTSVTGKPVGNDIREGKKTLMMQHAYRHGDETQKAFLAEMLGKMDLSLAEVEKVQSLTRELGGEAYARQRAQEFAQSAREAIASLPESGGKNLLLEFVTYIEKREK